MRSLLSVVVLLSALAASHAAPAPLPPRYAPFTEAEFDLGTAKERARLAGLYLRSRYLLEDASQDGGIASCLPDLDEGQRLAWLAERLTVTVQGDRARLRLRGDADDTLAVLGALADRLSGPPGLESNERRLRQIVDVFLQLRTVRPRGEPEPFTPQMIEDAEVQAGRFEVRSKRLTLLTRPRQSVRR